jgi:purine-binding chemotaxis protein CheW
MASIVESKKKSSGATAPAHPNEGQYLTFVLGGEVYALSIVHIKEIIQFGDLTEVPMMPKFVRGVINLRGKVVPVVDVSVRFGRELTAVARRTSIVLVEIEQPEDNETQSIGIMVDAVNEVIAISTLDIEPTPAFGAHIRPDFISGMAKHNDRFIVVLKLEMVLSMDEMSALGAQIIDTALHANFSDNMTPRSSPSEQHKIGLDAPS